MQNTLKPVGGGYLPDERPSAGKLLAFALQQMLVMFPATVTVALLTGFHVSTTIFASGLATLVFLGVTKLFSSDKTAIPLYYGSSFSYIAAIVGMTGAKFGETAPDALISQAQFGIIMSGLVSMVVGLIVAKFGMAKIEKVLPPSVTGSVALIIGASLFATALTSAAGYDATANTASSKAWVAALITLLATVLFSVFCKGVWKQLPILLGIVVGYVASICLGIVDFTPVLTSDLVVAPHFTLPKPNLAAVLAIMPIAIATIPESTAHLFQLDLYINKLADEKNLTGSATKQKAPRKYKIANKLGLNLFADGLCDIVASMFGGPAGTNYGENISTMSITKVFSNAVLAVAALLAMAVSFIGPVAAFINTIPAAVINGACIYLFGVIAVQGVALMISKKVNIFDERNVAVIAVILVIGIGGSFGFPGGMIPVFGAELPAIATAAMVGIFLNLVLNIGRKNTSTEEVASNG
ncbi:MAG: xanthine permease [Candidatus Nomurabacteria bacterium]|jgi:uracil permease|nr:xanthine permease [Candidatus Nomurabacteria bacterium]